MQRMAGKRLVMALNTSPLKFIQREFEFYGLGNRPRCGDLSLRYGREFKMGTC
jgi:hypothetical protein